MTVSAVRPWRRALQREACFPSSDFGPVLLSALRRLASICLYEVIGSQRPNWLRFVVLTGLTNCTWQRMCFKPKDARGRTWIDTGLFPPSRFIPATMHLAMMSSTKRNRKLVADLAAECR